jgi:hypothetical protein
MLRGVGELTLQHLVCELVCFTVIRHVYRRHAIVVLVLAVSSTASSERRTVLLLGEHDSRSTQPDSPDHLLNILFYNNDLKLRRALVARPLQPPIQLNQATKKRCPATPIADI